MKEFSTVAAWSHALSTKEISAVEAADFYIDRIEKTNSQLNAYITVAADNARAAALEIDTKRGRGAEEMSPLAGIPFGVKDAITTADITSTGAAKILSNYVPTYDATVIKRLKNAGAVVIGKQNCDAFGHGASNENSMYGPVYNPWNNACVAGGSSGGSAAAVAADACAFAIAEDTGGSIRAPASFCGVTGLKVSYGRTSRRGAMPMASSLDTVGPIARSAEDIALIMECIAGQDPHDGTSASVAVPQYSSEIKKPIKGKKIGIPAEYFSSSLDAKIRATVETAIKEFEKAGAKIVPIEMKHTEYAIGAYYIIVPCEDSSNLARLDGVRYGVRESADDLYHTYTRSRNNGFPDEVKRRIMIGTFALSHGYYDAYFAQAQKARTLIKKDFDDAFKKVDVIMSPTTPEVAFRVGEKTADPLKMYLQDVFVSPASLAGVCALSVPCGFVDAMPVGLQIIAPRMKEEIALQFGYDYQQRTDWHRHHPTL